MPAKKRELIEPHAGDKRYVRRDDQGRFNESDDVSRSLSQDVRRKAATVAKQALAEGKPIRQVVLERGYVDQGKLTEQQLDEALDVLSMTHP